MFMVSTGQMEKMEKASTRVIRYWHEGHLITRHADTFDVIEDGDISDFIPLDFVTSLPTCITRHIILPYLSDPITSFKVPGILPCLTQHIIQPYLDPCLVPDYSMKEEERYRITYDTTLLYIYADELEFIESIQFEVNGNTLIDMPGWLWRYLHKTYTPQSHVCFLPLNLVMRKCIAGFCLGMLMFIRSRRRVHVYTLRTRDYDAVVPRDIYIFRQLGYAQRDFSVTSTVSQVLLTFNFLQCHLYFQLCDGLTMQPVPWRDYLTDVVLSVDGKATQTKVMTQHWPETTYHIPIDPYVGVYIHHPLDFQYHLDVHPYKPTTSLDFWGSRLYSAVNMSRVRDVYLKWTWKVPVDPKRTFMLRVANIHVNQLSVGAGCAVWRFAS